MFSFYTENFLAKIHMWSSSWSLNFPAEISDVTCAGRRVWVIVGLKGTDGSSAGTLLPFEVNEGNSEELRTVWNQEH